MILTNCNFFIAANSLIIRSSTPSYVFELLSRPLHACIASSLYVTYLQVITKI